MPEGVVELPVPGRIVSGMVIGLSLVVLGAVDVGSAVLVVFAVVLGSVTSDTIVLSRPPMPPRRPSSVEEEETTPVGARRMPDELDDDVGTDDADSDESADAVEFADRVGRGVVVFDLKVGSTMSGGTDPVDPASSEVPLELLLGKADAGKESTSSPEPVVGGSVLEGFGVTTMVLAMMIVVTLPSLTPFVGLVLEAEVLELLLPPSKLPSRSPRSDS